MVWWRNCIKVGEIVNKIREDSDTEVEKDIVWNLEKNLDVVFVTHFPFWTVY